jgi:hypothetical protein
MHHLDVVYEMIALIMEEGCDIRKPDIAMDFYIIVI